MPTWLQVVNLPSTTISANDFLEAPCRTCGTVIPCEWDVTRKRWMFTESCGTCISKERKEHDLRLRFESSGLREAEKTLTLDTFRTDVNNQAAHTAAKRLADGEDLNLFLFGKAGRGKTHLAAGVVLERFEKDYVLFAPVNKLLMTVRSKMTEVPENELIDGLLRRKVLVLDDFGANKLTEWNLSFMDCLIDEWYRSKKSGLIITSNFSIREISERISDRIASRLFNICEVHELKGDDRRI